MADLQTDVRYIKGIGEQRAKALGKLEIRTLRDLISYFPRAYEDRSVLKEIQDLQDGEMACVSAMVAAVPTLSRIRKGLELVKLRAVDATGALDITYFNQAYLKDNLLPGETYLFYGKAEGSGRKWRMVNPVAEKEGAGLLCGRIVPIYSLTAGVTQNLLIKSITQGLTACRDLLPDPLPDEVRQAHDLCHISYAYDHVHFPQSADTLAIARRRLVFEELFLLTLGLGKLRSRRTQAAARPCEADLSDFYAALPFSLTGAQQRSIGEILGDMAKPRPMNRLVQGDVGSGKTMVAAAALLCAARSGLQAALMAPTSILAEQHYKGLGPLLESLGVRCALLTGATPAKTRRSILEQLRDGSIQVAIGTHALISEDVVYQQLGLVVTDEQHRFGVNQRSALSEKGRMGAEQPHLLVMSATPIPRTLALIIYGDLDVSVIDQLPPGRQHISTSAVDSSYHPRIYDFLRREIQAGRQAYVICPMVEQEDGGPGDERKAVTEYAAYLQKEVFPQLQVAFVHGKMKPKEKEAVMAAFAAGESQILVSTTVVEVGVDVPNASVIVIENAERFGLSQLHQLRGRVGRGSHKSYCILISDNQNEETRERLKVMTRTGDGFRIAEEDLRLRGPGDFFGQRQHGLPAMKIADLSCDMALLREAQEAARKLLEEDPDLALPQHRITRQRMEELFDEAAGALN